MNKEEQKKIKKDKGQDIFVLFCSLSGHIFNQIWHKSVDFEGVLKETKKAGDILGFSRQHDLFRC